MEPFTPELLTILSLISIIWTGITCIAVFVTFICYICNKRIRSRRSESKVSNQNRQSSSSFKSSDSISTSTLPEKPIKHHTFDGDSKHKHNATDHNKIKITNHQSRVIKERKNMYDRTNYTNDAYDYTTMNNNNNNNQNYGQRQTKQEVQRVPQHARSSNRETPYPPDIIAREKQMNRFRL